MEDPDYWALPLSQHHGDREGRGEAGGVGLRVDPSGVEGEPQQASG